MHDIRSLQAANCTDEESELRVEPGTTSRFGPETIVTAENVLIGNDGGDAIFGYGVDYLNGGAGNDVLVGSDGKDRIVDCPRHDYSAAAPRLDSPRRIAKKRTVKVPSRLAANLSVRIHEMQPTTARFDH